MNIWVINIIIDEQDKLSDTVEGERQVSVEFKLVLTATDPPA